MGLLTLRLAGLLRMDGESVSVHKDQIAFAVFDPGRFPPAPTEAYLQQYGFAAYERQRALWKRHNECQCEQIGSLHAIGCPVAK